MAQFHSELVRMSNCEPLVPWTRRFQWLYWALFGLWGATFAPAVLAAYNPIVNLQSAQNPSPQGVAINIFAYVTPNPGDARPTGTIRFFDSVGGSCAPSLIPVFRLFRGNARLHDVPNHRFTTSTAVYTAFIALGWDGESVEFCAPG